MSDSVTNPGGVKKSTAIAVLVLVVLVLLSVAFYFLMPVFQKQEQFDTSDAKEVKETIKIAGDNYMGYWFVTSPDMQRQCLNQGLRIDFVNDGGVYADRLQKFADGDYDMIMLPVNSYLEHGSGHKFPGVIVAAIAESRGADGICGFEDRFPSGKSLNNSLNNPGLKIAYTSQSPSEFLINLTIADFGLNELKDSKAWKMEVESSEKVYELAKQKKYDVFVLWEPDLSKALQIPGMKYLWGSDKFANYIIDVFVVNRDYLKKHEEALMTFFKTYFRVMDIYANNQEKMIDEMCESTNLKKDVVKKIFDKINWYDLEENATLEFGIAAQGQTGATEGIVNTILACTKVDLRNGKFQKDPLEGNPYLIINSSIMKELVKTGIVSSVGNSTNQVDFSSLDDGSWKKLREVGVMRVEPISFQQGDNLLDDDGKIQVDGIAQMLTNNYPGYRVVVRGHTGSGDESENLKLSQERADAVRQYLIAVHSLNANRLKAEGVGSTMPPKRGSNESERAFRYRLPRVEIILFESNKL